MRRPAPFNRIGGLLAMQPFPEAFDGRPWRVIDSATPGADATHRVLFAPAGADARQTQLMALACARYPATVVPSMLGLWPELQRAVALAFSLGQLHASHADVTLLGRRLLPQSNGGGLLQRAAAMLCEA